MSYKGSVDKCILLVSGMSLLGKLHLICGNLFNQNITFHFMLLLKPKLSESIILPEDTTKLLLWLWYGSYSSVRCIIVDMIFSPHRAFFLWVVDNKSFFLFLCGRMRWRPSPPSSVNKMKDALYHDLMELVPLLQRPCLRLLIYLLYSTVWWAHIYVIIAH